MNPRRLGAHPPDTLSKYGMTLPSQGWAAEFADAGIAFNCLWPQTYIATSAVANLRNGADQLAAARSPEIMADAAVAIMSRPSRKTTANCFLDTDTPAYYVGVDDFSHYGGGPNPTPDLFLD